MIPYLVSCESQEDTEFVRLVFRCCQTLSSQPQPFNVPNESILRHQVRQVKQPQVSLSRCLQATRFESVFFYAEKQMPNVQIGNNFLAKRWFTTGLSKVRENMEHKITNMETNNSSPAILVLYQCKDNKLYQYESHSNLYTAVVNEKKIREDFETQQMNEESIILKSNSIYFFYTTCASSFKIEFLPSKRKAELITIEDDVSSKKRSVASSVSKQLFSKNKTSNKTPNNQSSNILKNKTSRAETLHQENLSKNNLDVEYLTTDMEELKQNIKKLENEKEKLGQKLNEVMNENETLIEEMTKVKNDNKDLVTKEETISTALQNVLDVLRDGRVDEIN